MKKEVIEALKKFGFSNGRRTIKNVCIKWICYSNEDSLGAYISVLHLNDMNVYDVELHFTGALCACKRMTEEQILSPIEFKKCLDELCDKGLERIGNVAAEIARFKMTGA